MPENEERPVGDVVRASLEAQRQTRQERERPFTEILGRALEEKYGKPDDQDNEED